MGAHLRTRMLRERLRTQAQAAARTPRSASDSAAVSCGITRHSTSLRRCSSLQEGMIGWGAGQRGGPGRSQGLGQGGGGRAEPGVGGPGGQ